MCGIAGIYRFRTGEPADQSLIEAMTGALRHRGPDDRGFYLAGPVGLGMQRLSIIDLEGGHQPIGNEDGTIQVIFNGEIYNYRALRSELEGRGHRFRTRSDTEVIAHGYEEFGIEVLQKLNGMFAIAVWDAPRRRLFLSRDRLGIKPLYYAETPSGIVFASELKSLLAGKEISTDLDPVAIQQYLAWHYVPAPRSPLSVVRKLRPATWLLADPGGCRFGTYWRLQPGEPVRDEREAEEGLRWHLTRSVGLQMQADVPVGAFLSGGLDSSALVAVLRKLRDDSFYTFCIGFGEEDFDETRYARKVAATFGTRHVEEILRPDCRELIEEVAGFLDEPFADNSILPTYLVSRMARRSVKVVLSGDGGDELLAGYDHYKAHRIDAAYSRLPATLRCALRAWAGDGAGERPTKRGSWRRKIRRLEEARQLPSFLEHARWLVRSTDLLDADRVMQSCGFHEREAWMEPFREIYGESPFPRGLDRQLDVDLRTLLADDILFKLDRASMANSLEARVPYLDHELVEYVFRIPERWKLRGLSGKWILRSAFKGRVPPEIVRRRKSGFSVPIAAWLRKELREMLRDLLEPGRLKRQGLFRTDVVLRILGEHESGTADHSRPLWALLMFQLWSMNYLEREGCWRV